MFRILSMLAGLMVLVAGGCAAHPDDPSFAVTTGAARDAVAEMRDHPRPLTRPLVVIGGYGDPSVAAPLLANYFGGMTEHATIIPVSIGLCGTLDECRQKVIEAVDRQCPSADPLWTTEVDVIGASLGGLVGRYSAAPSRDSTLPRRLKIARLFSISSPHAGATVTELAALTQMHRDLIPGSEFLKWLAGHDAQATYQIFPYVILGDEIVGDRYAAPPGQNPYWLANDAPLPPHLAAMLDERILGDIARRLRGEPPFTRPPPVPIPGAK